MDIENEYGLVLFRSSPDASTVREAVGEAYLRGVNLRGADLSGADLSGADLSGADLSGAYLRGANLIEVKLRGADLRGADLSGAYLRGATLSGANLHGANLNRAYLSGADLTEADLTEADLTGADLSRTDVIDGGQDARGYMFWAWRTRDNAVVYRAGCREYVGVTRMIAHYGETYASNGDPAECRARVELLASLALRRWGVQ